MTVYTEPYTTPYYDGLKAHGIRLPAVLQLIRTDKARFEKTYGRYDVAQYVSRTEV